MNLQYPKQPFHPDLTVPSDPYLGVHLSIELNLIVQLHSVGILAAKETMQLRKWEMGQAEHGCIRRKGRFLEARPSGEDAHYLNTMRWSSMSTWTSVLSSTQNSMNTYLGLSYHSVRACCLKRSCGGAS